MSRQAPRMQDPAGGVPPQLLPHMHLVSSYRYPTMHNLSTETAVEYLLQASKVVRELQPMHWMFLDAPSDGGVMLVWQPLNHLGTNFASDGYVWADSEQVYTAESRGYAVEVWVQRCGYHPPNENVATHCRKRYRLMPSKNANPHLPTPDPSLWIVHYCKAPSLDHIPANRIPVPPQTQNILAQRRFLQSQGQLARKDFMLHDRNSWPTINLPAHVGHPYPPGGRQQQGMFGAAQQGSGMTPPKSSRGQRQSVSATDFSLEEEDTSSGDLFDNITPRDISRMRYRNHHEWMEEIFASPYRISQITPVDLGLGRKGELESVTNDFFYTPSGPAAAKAGSSESNAPAAVGKLEPGKADEFSDAISRKIADMTAEMETLKKQHARKMSGLQKGSVLKDGEVRLRDALTDPADSGSEFWRLEGHLHLNKDESAASQMQYENQKPKEKVEDVVRDIEQAWGKQIAPVTEVVCVDRGGYQERVEPVESPKPADAQESVAADISMANTEIQPEPAKTEASTEAQPASGTIGAQQQPAPSGTAAEANIAQGPQGQQTEPTADVEMGGMQPEGMKEESGVSGTGTKEEGGAPEGPKPEDGANNQGIGDVSAPTATSPPGKGLEGLTPGGGPEISADSILETSNFDDVAGFNSAGEALAAYGDQNDELDLGGLDNSAFGDAFHAPEEDHVHHDTEEIP